MVPTGMQAQYHPSPNAALLIDFDNVTMAIRSDLGKELKTLLNSDVIRGKVAVQRAYADWRRYPQYIVPLAESSVDLIFAPAYGSAKKNATDLRMAIDAMELVFTRPEIGTFILMTGDSDFSSCVLKLKEYGKYVIGVGMRESSSDLLIQNCDEYYSYHSIGGLTRAGLQTEDSKEDPWVLVKRAVQQMVKNGDVMRTDRLKQVMLDLDPAFDEKKIGYTKFSRFVSEAATKNLIRLRKTENGQYEILGDVAEAETAAPAAPMSREKVVERIVAEAEASTRDRGRGRGRGRGPREERPARELPQAIAGTEAPLAEPFADAGGWEELPSAAPAPEPPQRPAREEQWSPEPEQRARPEAAARASVEEESAPAQSGLEHAYSLLQEALRRLTGRDGKAVRDGDVKRKMLEISRDFDETKLGFPKFTRFLRQAHDAEVIDLTRAGAGNYEVASPAGGKKLPPPRISADAGIQRDAERVAVAPAPTPEEPRSEGVERPEGARGGRDRSRGRGGRGRRDERVEVVVPSAEVVAGAADPEASVVEAPIVAAPWAAVPSAPAASAPASGVTTPSIGGLRGRRGGRGPLLDGPPPILPGQAIQSPLQAAQLAAVAVEKSAAEAASEPLETREAAIAAVEAAGATPAADASAPSAKRGRNRSRGGRGGGNGKAQKEEEVSAPTPAAEAGPVVAEESARGRSRRGRQGGGKAEVAAAPTAKSAARRNASPAVKSTSPDAAASTPAAKSAGKGGRGSAPAEGQRFSPTALGLPSNADEVRSYLGAYKGVGQKTADALLEAYGARVFDAMQNRSAEVKALLGDKRADVLLEQWSSDFKRRSAGSQKPAKRAAARAAVKAEPEAEKPKTASRSRRGSRGRGGSKDKPSAE